MVSFKKKFKTFDIVQTGRRKGGGKEVRCNIQNLLKCCTEKKWPKTAEFMDKFKENIDLFAVEFCQF